MNKEKELKLEELDKVSGGWRTDFYMDVVIGAWYRGDHRVYHVLSRRGTSNIWNGDIYWKNDDTTIRLYKSNAEIYLSEFDYEHAQEIVDPSIFTIL